jgi:hypothetical protein
MSESISVFDGNYVRLGQAAALLAKAETPMMTSRSSILVGASVAHGDPTWYTKVALVLAVVGPCWVLLQASD